MVAGMVRRLAMGMAVFGFFVGLSMAGESARDMLSLRRNARVTIGGEIMTDFTHRNMSTSGLDADIKMRAGDLSVRNANLRLNADVHPNVRAVFKLDLSPDSDWPGDDDILAEAILVMHAVGGTGLELFAGKGRAPYGQDVTLGMVQSYHHAANRNDSPEGGVFIIDPPGAATGRGRALPPMRPGQMERSFMVGAAYQWDERWRVEVAAFQPEFDQYRHRLDRDGRSRGSGSDIGFAGRLWVSPIEGLVLEASFVAPHSTSMGTKSWRTDVAVDAVARKNAYALSLGVDWRVGDWRFFGEYQHGWDWNFTENYDTETWQAGLSRDIGRAWRLGAMAEGLEIQDPTGTRTIDDFFKLSFTLRYAFSSGVFLLAEYGHEWHRREKKTGALEKRRGNFAGMRIGMRF